MTPLNKALLNSLGEVVAENLEWKKLSTGLVQEFQEREKKRGVPYVPCFKPSLLFSVMANRLIGLVGEVVAEQANFSFATRPLAFRLLTLAPAASSTHSSMPRKMVRVDTNLPGPPLTLRRYLGKTLLISMLSLVLNVAATGEEG